MKTVQASRWIKALCPGCDEVRMIPDSGLCGYCQDGAERPRTEKLPQERVYLPRLQETREALGVTRAMVSGQIRISQDSLKQYEEGVRPLMPVAVAIAEVLGVKLEDLKTAGEVEM